MECSSPIFFFFSVVFYEHLLQTRLGGQRERDKPWTRKRGPKGSDEPVVVVTQHHHVAAVEEHQGNLWSVMKVWKGDHGMLGSFKGEDTSDEPVSRYDDYLSHLQNAILKHGQQCLTRGDDDLCLREKASPRG